MAHVKEFMLAAAVTAAAITATTAAADGPAADVTAAGREQSTQLISRTPSGDRPNGPSTNAVISGDRRYARVIAFESEASDLTRGDTNDAKDVFAIKRRGTINNAGTAWSGGDSILVSRGLSGDPADGPSFSPSVSGDFRSPGRCIAFLSDATNLVEGDTNGQTDAFLVKDAGDAPERVSLPGNEQSNQDTNGVSVSGDCSRVTFTTGGEAYTRVGNKTTALSSRGDAADPSWSAGNSDSVVFADKGGVYLSKSGTGKPDLVAPGGTNPVLNDIKRQTLAYEKRRNGRVQIFYKDLGGRERVISKRGRRNGNKPSRNPVIGNSGFYVAFESDATNLSVDAANRTGDRNNDPDSYLFTDSRDITLVQSVEKKSVPLPGGGKNPSMSFYSNYLTFDSPAPAGSEDGDHQIYMRYLGGI